MKIRVPFYLILVLLSVQLSLSGCAGGANVYSTADDIKLGEQVKAEIAKNPQKYPVLNNESVRGYVQNIMNRVVSSSVYTHKEFKYSVTIINDDKTVNAFCIPGGAIYVYTGLLKYIDNEAELAGILGHEATHADHRHSTQQMTKQYGAQVVAGLLLGNNPSAVGQIAAGVANNLVMLNFSREDELDADKNSFYALNALPGKPWYPAAITYFMRKTLQKTGRTSDLEKLFLTHPPSEERLAAVNGYAKTANLPPPTEANLNENGYAQFRRTLP